jgi:hypothetical protein
VTVPAGTTADRRKMMTTAQMTAQVAAVWAARATTVTVWAATAAQ